MIRVIFETHAASVDNVAHRASGHADAPLAEIGERQARALGERHAGTPLAAVFCSDLQRSYRTAELAFAGRDVKIVRDRRLRELDYGEWTRRPSDEVFAEGRHRIEEPFPGGESYTQAAARVGDVLSELLRDYDGKTVMIIGHRATHYAIEHLANRIPLEQIMAKPWQWQPGWIYTITRLDR